MVTQPEPPEVKIVEQDFFVNITKNESGVSTVDVPTTPNKASPYKDKFKQGATLVPRPYVFVEVNSQRGGVATVSTISRYGKDASKRYRKKEWMVIESRKVPEEMLYKAVLGECIESFKLKQPKTVMLPIIPSGDNYRFVVDQEVNSQEDSYELSKASQMKLGELNTPTKVADTVESWFIDLLNDIETDWESIRGDKFDVNGGSSQKKSVLDNFDYNSKLTVQRPTYEYAVVYNQSGSRPRAAVVEDGSPIIDYRAYYMYTDSRDEAHYLSGMLNSDYIYEILTELGILSSRDIQKKPFEIPIPKFDPSNKNHVELSKEADDKRDNTDTLEQLVENILTSSSQSQLDN